MLSTQTQDTYMPDYGRSDHKGKGYQARYYPRTNNDHYYYQQEYYSRNQSEDWKKNDRNEGYEYANNHRREEARPPESSRVNPNQGAGCQSRIQDGRGLGTGNGGGRCRLSEKNRRRGEGARRPESCQSNADGDHRRGIRSWKARMDNRLVGVGGFSQQTFADAYWNARYMSARSNYIEFLRELKNEGRLIRQGQLSAEYCKHRDREGETLERTRDGRYGSLRENFPS